MKKLLYAMVTMICAVTFSGCSSLSPFDYGNNWLIRENDIPQFYSTFDLFYIGKAPAEYGDTHDIQFNWTKTHTNDIFGRGVRVFAPEIRKAKLEKLFIQVVAVLQFKLKLLQLNQSKRNGRS